MQIIIIFRTLISLIEIFATPKIVLLTFFMMLKIFSKSVKWRRMRHKQLAFFTLHLSKLIIIIILIYGNKTYRRKLIYSQHLVAFKCF
jgi:hypothetical protein